MLPDVQPHDGLASGHDGVVLVRRGIDDELAIADEKPGPTGAKAARSRGSELGFEVGERAESGLDGAREIALRLASAALLHNLPEHGVVPMAATVVANGGADGVGNGVKIPQQVFQRFRLQAGMAFQRLVQIVDVRAVVLVVMNFHRFGINVGF